jgi:hypothetical protein
LKRFLLCLVCAAAVGTHAFGQSVVVPNAYASTAGGDTSGSVGPGAARFQFVVNPGQMPAGPIKITGFTVRAAPGTGASSFTATGTINLATSTGYANNNGHPLISTTFANNIGAGNTLVYSGSFTINNSACAGPAPCPFGNVVTLQTPFLYNPANGPLLLDFQATTVTITGNQDVFDCSETGPNYCAVTSLVAIPPGPTGVLQGGNSIFELTYTPQATTSVPALGMWGLAALALGLVAIYWRLTRRPGNSLDPTQS